MVLGLVEKLGDRAPGPCPALLSKGDGFTCGMVARPKDYIESGRGVTVLREAAMLMIGAGAGCDEAGDEPDGTAWPKQEAVALRYLERVGQRRLEKARATIFGEA